MMMMMMMMVADFVRKELDLLVSYKGISQ